MPQDPWEPGGVFLDFFRWTLRGLQTVQEVQQKVAPVLDAINQFRRGSNCANTLTGGGAVVGGVVGMFSGSLVGGVVGAGVGSVEPGGGTALGGFAGASLGRAGGALVGGAGGGALGGVGAAIICNKSAGDGGGSDGAGAGNLRKLSPSEIKKLSDAGHDAETIKKEIVGSGGSRYDLFKTSTGDIVVKLKSGAGEGQPTGLNIRHL